MSASGYLFNERPPAGLLIAQAVGITASAYFLGQNVGLSFIAIPALMLAPAPVAARSWRKMYDIGKGFGLSLILLSTLGTASAAYYQDPSSTPFKLNVAAAMLFPCVMLYTFLFMFKTNNRLMEKANSLTDKSVEEAAMGDSVKQLLEKWARLNLGRAGIIAAGAAAAIWAALDK